MWPGRAADHSPPFSAAVMEEYSYTSTHPPGHTGPVTGSQWQCCTAGVYYPIPCALQHPLFIARVAHLVHLRFNIQPDMLLSAASMQHYHS